MSSNNFAKRNNKCKLSFFQQKDSKKFKTSIADPVANTQTTPDIKGKKKADDSNMKVNSIISINPFSNTVMSNPAKFSKTSLNISIHASDKLN